VAEQLNLDSSTNNLMTIWKRVQGKRGWNQTKKKTQLIHHPPLEMSNGRDGGGWSLYVLNCRLFCGYLSIYL